MSSAFLKAFGDNGQRTRELIETTDHDLVNIKRLREYNAGIPLNEVINMYQ